jgi:general secretion pathway protein D
VPGSRFRSGENRSSQWESGRSRPAQVRVFSSGPESTGMQTTTENGNHEMPRARPQLFLAIGAVLLFAGCPKQNTEFEAGAHAEAAQDYDTALVHYERALGSSPSNAQYKLRRDHVRFEAGQLHVEQGEKALDGGDLNLALAEFRRAQTIDPSSSAADQNVRRTLELLARSKVQQTPQPEAQVSEEAADSLTGPPQLKPMSREPVNLKMTNDSRMAFQTIAELAGISVIFDPDFVSRRVSVDLPNVTLEQALDLVATESKAFWKPMTSSVILVAPDNPQKRRDIDDEEVETIYLSNTDTPQDMTEIVTGLRQLLDLRRVQQVNARNAIVIRDTPDKLDIAEKIIHDIDQAKPEVLLEVSILQTSLDRLHDLGILPGQSATVSFTPRSALTPNSSSNSDCGTSSASSGCTQLTLDNLKNLSLSDYSVTLPGATVNAVLTDSTTRIIQDPEIRVTDGQKATLKIGDRVPVATGSFGTGTGATGVSPLVNTQFQYIDVGVNVDVTPRVHPDDEISLNLKVEVSSVTGTETIGGISQPIISQRTVEHDIRLKDGEVNVLGGLLQRTESNSVNGWPGLAQLPFFRYFFSDNKKEVQDDEVLIVLTPHIIRIPEITEENLRRMAVGSDTNTRVYREEENPVEPAASAAAAVPTPTAATGSSSSPSASALRFDPSTVTLKTGGTTTLALSVSDVHDLFSVPLLIQYNPAVVQIEDIRDGGFLSGGSQEIAIVQRLDNEKGQAIISATRQPNSAGVNGSGTLVGITIRAVAPGTSPIQILQVDARDSQQKPIRLTSSEGSVQVQ